MTIELKRTHRTDTSLDGELYISGVKVCDTAENPQTALPPGTYPVLIHRCKQYRRKMPVIGQPGCAKCRKLDAVNNNTTLPRVCPQIKIGNGVFHRTDGSIIIGERIVWGCLKHPVEHFNRLIDRLDKAAIRGGIIELNVVNG